MSWFPFMRRQTHDRVVDALIRQHSQALLKQMVFHEQQRREHQEVCDVAVEGYRKRVDRALEKLMTFTAARKVDLDRWGCAMYLDGQVVQEGRRDKAMGVLLAGRFGRMAEREFEKWISGERDDASS